MKYFMALVFSLLIFNGVPRTRIELARPKGHMALNHARLPVPPPGLIKMIISFFQKNNPQNLASTPENYQSLL